MFKFAGYAGIDVNRLDLTIRHSNLLLNGGNDLILLFDMAHIFIDAGKFFIQCILLFSAYNDSKLSPNGGKRR